MDALTEIILTVSVQVSILVVVVSLVQRFALANRPKASSRMLSLSMLLLLGLGGAAFLPLPSWVPVAGQRIEHEIAASSTDSVNSVQDEAFISIEEIPSQKSKSTDVMSTAAAYGWQDQLALFSSQLNTTPSSGTEHTMIVGSVLPLVCYSVVLLVVIGIVRFGFGVISICRLRHSSTAIDRVEILRLVKRISRQLGFDREISVFQSDRLATAATIGFRQPEIYLAVDFHNLDSEVQESILAHEIAHIHHGDFYANVVSQACAAFYFFNPLVHWLVRNMRLNQEIAADIAAAEITFGAEKYSRMLATIALRQDRELQNASLASTFLMPPNSFIQRIKMLNTQTEDMRLTGRFLMHAFVVAVAVVVCGMRAPIREMPLPPVAIVAKPAQSEEKPASVFSTEYVGNRPDQGVLFVRPAEILESPLLKKVLEIGPFKGAFRGIESMFESSTGVGASQIEQFVTVTSFSESEAIERSWFIAKTFEDNLENFKALGESVSDRDSFPIAIQRDEPGIKFGLIVDERTIVWAYTEKSIEYIKQAGKSTARRAAWYSDFNKVAKRDAVFVGSGEQMKTFGRDMLPKRQLEKIATCKTMVASASVNQSIGYEVAMEYLSSTDANAAEKAVGKVVKTWKRLLAAASNSSDVLTKSMGLSAMTSVDEMDVQSNGKTLTLKSSFDIDVKTLNAAAGQLRSAARRTQSMNNQRQLALAMHSYESAYGHFPKAVITHESGHKHSWRIALLPFLEQQELYDRYRLDEPWDSPHNKQVTRDMPEFYKHPESESKTETNYFVVVGEGTLFDGKENTFSDITDGSSNTVLIVEAIRDCHWAQPVDILFEEASLVETLGGFDEKIFSVTTADGAVKTVSFEIKPEFFRSMLTIAGGEMLNAGDQESVD